MARGTGDLRAASRLAHWVDTALDRLGAERVWVRSRWRIGPYDLTTAVRQRSVWEPSLRSLISAPDDVAPVSFSVHATTVDHLARIVERPDPAWVDPAAAPLTTQIQAGRHRLIWDSAHGMICAMSLDRRAGFVAATGTPPEWEMSQPFRMQVHWLSASLGDAMVHAGSVGDDRGALLVVGASGAGKSTTTIAGIAHGMRTCGDDYVHVSVDHGGHVARPLYGVVKTRRNAKLAVDATLAGAPHRETAETSLTVLHELHTSRPDAFASSMRLRGIVVLRLPEPVVTPGHGPTTPLAAALAATPSTLGQTPYEQEASLRFIARLAEELPCFEVRPPADLEGTARLIRAVLAQVCATGASAP